MEARQAITENRMKETWKGKWRLHRLILPEKGKIENYERIPTEITYLIPSEHVETAIVYNPIIHDPRYVGVGTSAISVVTETEVLNDSAFKAGASFFAEISAEFGREGKKIPSEFETNITAEQAYQATVTNCMKGQSPSPKNPSSVTNEKDDKDEVVVIEDLEEDVVVLENSSDNANENATAANANDHATQILQDDSHLPNINSKEVQSTLGKLIIRRPSLNIISENSIKMIFDKSQTIEKSSEDISDTSKRNENKSKINGKGLEKELKSSNDVIEKITKKIETKEPERNITKENALARLAFDYDMEKEEDTNMSTDNQNDEENSNTESEPFGMITIPKSTNFETTEKSQTIHSDNNNRELQKVQDSLEKQTETAENIDGKIIPNLKTIEASLDKDIIETNKVTESLARINTENSEIEKNNSQNEMLENSTKETEVNKEQSVSFETESNETMTFHKSTEDEKDDTTTVTAMKKVTSTKKVLKIIKKVSRKIRGKYWRKTVLSSKKSSVKNNYCSDTLRALIESEVEALMKTKIMKELQNKIVSQFLQEKDVNRSDNQRTTPSQGQESQSPSENNLISTHGLFSPSLFPVEEVNTESNLNGTGSQNCLHISPVIAITNSQNQTPSRCTPDCTTCKSPLNVNGNSQTPLRNNNDRSQLNSATDGLFYSDMQILKSNITYDEVQTFAKSYPGENAPNKVTRKRKSTENAGGKVKNSNQKKPVENSSKSRGAKNKMVSALQLVGLDDGQGQHTDLRVNSQLTNRLQIIPPDLNCHLPVPQLNSQSTFQQQYDANAFSGHSTAIVPENTPRALYHYYPPQIHSQNDPSKETMKNSPCLPFPVYPGLSLSPSSACVQPVTSSLLSRQQMHYEQISPPMNISQNLQGTMDLNYSNANSTNYENNRLFFLSPGDHQQYLRQQLHSRVHVQVNQHLHSNPLYQLHSTYGLPDDRQNTYPG